MKTIEENIKYYVFVNDFIDNEKREHNKHTDVHATCSIILRVYASYNKKYDRKDPLLVATVIDTILFHDSDGSENTEMWYTVGSTCYYKKSELIEHCLKMFNNTSDVSDIISKLEKLYKVHRILG